MITLDVSNNQLTDISNEIHAFQSTIQRMNFDHNEITHFTGFNTLLQQQLLNSNTSTSSSLFPNLTELSLIDNPLTHYSTLRTLLLHTPALRNFSFVDENKKYLSSLDAAVCSNEYQYEHMCMDIVLMELTNLKLLNGIKVEDHRKTINSSISGSAVINSISRGTIVNALSEPGPSMKKDMFSHIAHARQLAEKRLRMKKLKEEFSRKEHQQQESLAPEKENSAKTNHNLQPLFFPTECESIKPPQTVATQQPVVVDKSDTALRSPSPLVHLNQSIQTDSSAAQISASTSTDPISNVESSIQTDPIHFFDPSTHTLLTHDAFNNLNQQISQFHSTHSTQLTNASQKLSHFKQKIRSDIQSKLLSNQRKLSQDQQQLQFEATQVFRLFNQEFISVTQQIQFQLSFQSTVHSQNELKLKQKIEIMEKECRDWEEKEEKNKKKSEERAEKSEIEHVKMKKKYSEEVEKNQKMHSRVINLEQDLTLLQKEFTSQCNDLANCKLLAASEMRLKEAAVSKITVSTRLVAEMKHKLETLYKSQSELAAKCKLLSQERQELAKKNDVFHSKILDLVQFSEKTQAVQLQQKQTFEATQEQLQSDLDQLRSENEHLRYESKSAQNDIMKEKSNNARVIELEQKLLVSSENNSLLQAQLNSFSENEIELNRRLQEVQQYVKMKQKDWEQREDDLCRELEAEQKENLNLVQTVESLQDEIKEFRVNREQTKGLKAENEKLNAQLEEKRNMMELVFHEIENVKNEFRVEKNKQNELINTQQTQIQTLNQQVQTLEQIIESLEKKLKSTTEELGNRTSKATELAREYQKLAKKLQQSQLELDEKNKEIEKKKQVAESLMQQLQILHQ